MRWTCWRRCWSRAMRRVPAPVAQAVRALRLKDPLIERAQNPKALLHFADRAGLSLFLPQEMFGAAERDALAQRLDGNRQRVAQLRQLYGEVADCLRAREIPFAFLKGLTQCGLSGHDPERRVQY